MKKSKLIIVVSIAVAIVVVVFIAYLLRSVKGPVQVNQLSLGPGWQFYAIPTTMEQPGTVFRIDQDGRKYTVENLEVPSLSGAEVMGETTQTVETKAKTVARFIGVKGEAALNSIGDSLQKFEFSMSDTIREITTDKDLADILAHFIERVTYKPNNRYYVIRESRSAMELNYTVSASLVASIGGEGSLLKLLTGNASFIKQSANKYRISQKFSQRMRVLFLPEEIVQSEVGLQTGTPKFMMKAVQKPLEFTL